MKPSTSSREASRASGRLIHETAACGADLQEIIAVDRPLCAALEIIERAAARRGGVLIMGPTGVGKELLAQRVHKRSGRMGAFVAVNCAAFHEGTVESALFGHVRGAFTGAVADLPGAILESHRGTLFLDEFGELSAAVQAKLLRVLEEGTVRPLGAARRAPVDLRVVAATNRDLRSEIDHARFRADLYFRVATFLIEIPPLRERQRDLAELLAKLSRDHDRGHAVKLSPAAEQAFLAYGWPGNVRELRNIVERVFTLAPEGELGLDELRELAPELLTGMVDPTSQTLAAIEDRTIIDRLRHGGTRRRVAEELGIHRSTLWRRMKRLQAG